jgi:hypothetical protein
MAKRGRKAMAAHIKAALVLDGCSTSFLVELSPPEFVQFAQKCSIYNGMTEASFRALAKQIDENAPRMLFGNGNPNRCR